MSYVEYQSNNSGGGWWLNDDDWRGLEKAGWEVEWYKPSTDGKWHIGDGDKDGRWLGALATRAKRRGLSLEDAVREWISVTGQDPADEGCNCCGQPHDFTEYSDDGKYLHGLSIQRNNSWGIS